MAPEAIERLIEQHHTTIQRFLKRQSLSEQVRRMEMVCKLLASDRRYCSVISSSCRQDQRKRVETDCDIKKSLESVIGVSAFEVQAREAILAAAPSQESACYMD